MARFGERKKKKGEKNGKMEETREKASGVSAGGWGEMDNLDSLAASNAVLSYLCFTGGKEEINNEKQINKLFAYVF